MLLCRALGGGFPPGRVGENRHRTGWAVLLFLTIATVLAYLAYRNIWANAKREVSMRGPLEPAFKERMEEQKAERGIAG